MSDENVAAVRRLFAAVEARDLDGVLAAYDPDVVIQEADSLPYGGTYRGLDGATRHADAYEATWEPLQEPGRRALEAEVLDAGEYVVVLWRQRGRSPDGGSALDQTEPRSRPGRCWPSAPGSSGVSTSRRGETRRRRRAPDAERRAAASAGG